MIYIMTHDMEGPIGGRWWSDILVCIWVMRLAYQLCSLQDFISLDLFLKNFKSRVINIYSNSDKYLS